ncbi:hypothetical protein LEMLEM_LOCUS3579, partial [Lemmus lemmus]
KSDRLNFIKRTSWILPRIVHEVPITGARTFYTDANKSGEEKLWIPSKLIKVRLEGEKPLQKET